MRVLRKLNLHRPTIVRDLTASLVLVITVVFGLASTINYFYSLSRDTAALYEKAEEIMDNLASLLVRPLWNIDTAELRKIVDVYRQSGIVLDIRLVDDSNQEIVAPTRSMEAAFLELTRVINYDNKPIGRVTVAYSDAHIVAKQREVAVYTAIVFATLTLTLVLATALLMRRFLSDPFAKLKTGLERISSGDYEHRFERLRQEDVNDITQNVMRMAREIKKREAALEENRQKLEVLNQAILDIFSCPDANGLVRTTMELANKVCGVDFGWFLGHRPPVGELEQQAAPSPRVCVRGHSFEATAQEVEAHVHQEPTDRVFSFALRSRHHPIGQMTLAFEQPPDASVASLLKSLMSLATLALIRQSFIRETAYIAAELQVAEAVQRSMLPDEARTPARAVVAYHYEPVLRVGGDWFSVIESRDKADVYVILGDVTGHGLAQGLVTTAVAGALQVLESLIHDVGSTAVAAPSQIVTQLNNVIARIAGKSNLRMTCVAAKLELASRRLLVCNAGHTFPVILRRSGAALKVETLTRNQQYMLGEETARENGFSYSDAAYPLGDDDVLFLYTDGLTDAVDREGKSFSRKFHRFFNRLGEPTAPHQMKDDLIKLLRAHTQEVPVKDDICVLVVAPRQEKAAGAA